MLMNVSQALVKMKELALMKEAASDASACLVSQKKLINSRNLIAKGSNLKVLEDL
jgi:hypothetical protein